MQYGVHQQPKPSGVGSTISQPDAPQGGYKDPIWAFVFLANVVAVFVAAVLNYKNISFKDDSPSSGSSSGSQKDSKGIIAALALSFVSGIGFSIIWTRYLCRPSVATNIIKVAMGIALIHGVISVVACFAVGAVGPGILMLISFLLTAVWYYFVRNRIAFTAVMLEMAATCTREFGSMIYIALFVQFVSAAFFVVWTIAILGSFPAGKDPNSLVAFLLLLSLYWTTNVCFNLVQVGVGGVAATWFYRSQTDGVVSSSMKRACTTSFGSVCLGSFIVAVIEALRTIARSVSRENGNAFVVCIVDCILGFIQWVAEFISKYAYAYVAIWGQDFCTAAKNTWTLFKTRGFDVIVNDDLSNLAFMFSALAGGVVAALFSGVICFAIVGKGDAIIAALILGFFVGALITSIAMSVLSACVTTFFVLWAEDPSPLATNHPALHQKLVAAVRKMYPNIQGPI